MLDLANIRLFVLAAEFGSLTRAAEAAGTVQPVVSQRLKTLEARLGRRLLDRTPRLVRPTAAGERFLPHARALLAAHDAALGFDATPAPRLALGVSDHALGVALPEVLRQLRAALPADATLTVQGGMSAALREAQLAGTLDAVVIRREGGTGGEVLGQDPLGWRAAETLSLAADAPVPLALLPTPCGVRAAALRVLEGAGRPWREACTAGGCATLLAAARAGFGIAPMGRVAAGGMPDRGGALGLPPLPPSEVVLLGRAASPAAHAALRALAAAVRAALAGPRA